MHFLFECRMVQHFWTVLCAWFAGVEDLALDSISPKLFVLGVPQVFRKAAIVNFILMNVKFYVYRQRLFHEGKLELLQWLREFKLKLFMEKQICYNEGKAKRFGKWAAILDTIW